MSRIPGDGGLEIDVGKTAFGGVEFGFFGTQLNTKLVNINETE